MDLTLPAMVTPAHIRVLSAHVANKIAAGEVVERPSSVLKELLENAVDAGATQVDVELAAGGRKLVAVRDNGTGMGRDDALLSVERHATSKIRDVDEIERIATLGFRGEALAAIASVSRFRLLTCLRGETVGTELLINGGTISDVRDAGCPSGTSFEVRDLFFNVPARRKFLRSHETELAHAREMFIMLALSHPAIGMSLKVDGRETYRLAEGASLEDRLRDLFGSDYIKGLKPLDHSCSDMTCRGYVSAPLYSRSDRNEQFIFVNGRATSAPVLSFAIRESYRSLIAGDRHPAIFLYINLEPSLVDVNVHPTKREVRFRKSNDVRDAIITAIRASLGTPGEQRGSDDMPFSTMRIGDMPRAAGQQVQLRIDDLPPTRAFQYPRMVQDPVTSGATPSTTPCNAATSSPADAQAVMPGAPWVWCRVIGQIGGLYVVLETEDGYVLMDPHAAHERILFERFMADFLNGRIQHQSLLIPQTVELRPGDAARVRKHIELFRSMGFGISEFGGDSFVVDAMPSYFAGLNAPPLMAEIAQTMEESGERGAGRRWREESIAQAACKAAVKARDKLNLDEIEKLVIDLARTEMPYTCPHGRPTLIFTSFRDLNKKFGRE